MERDIYAHAISSRKIAITVSLLPKISRRLISSPIPTQKKQNRNENRMSLKILVLLKMEFKRVISLCCCKHDDHRGTVCSQGLGCIHTG